MSNCSDSDGRLAAVDKLASFGRISCPPGFALTMLDGPGKGCDSNGGMHMDFMCASVYGYDVVTDGISSAARPLPPRSAYTSESLCTPLVGQSYDGLQWHPVTCGVNHVLNSFHLTREGCTNDEMHFRWTCIPLKARIPSTPVDKRDLVLVDKLLLAAEGAAADRGADGDANPKDSESDGVDDPPAL